MEQEKELKPLEEKNGIEETTKNDDIAMAEEANKISQEKVEAIKTQRESFEKLLDEVQEGVTENGEE